MTQDDKRNWDPPLPTKVTIGFAGREVSLPARIVGRVFAPVLVLWWRLRQLLWRSDDNNGAA